SIWSSTAPPTCSTSFSAKTTSASTPAAPWASLLCPLGSRSKSRQSLKSCRLHIRFQCRQVLRQRPQILLPDLAVVRRHLRVVELRIDVPNEVHEPRGIPHWICGGGPEFRSRTKLHRVLGIVLPWKRTAHHIDRVAPKAAVAHQSLLAGCVRA